jgi:uncharacterized paraquat-inducible protein A
MTYDPTEVTDIEELQRCKYCRKFDTPHSSGTCKQCREELYADAMHDRMKDEIQGNDSIRDTTPREGG